MTMKSLIASLNAELSVNNYNLTLKEYFKIYHEKCISKVDISFMDYFLYLCDHEEEFVVEQEKLKEYNVLNNIDTSKDIKRALEKFDLIEGEDYLLGKVAQQDYKHGGSNAKLYTLTPESFKLCLIRAKNSKKYANYYLLLEKVVNSYNKYEKLCKDNLLNQKVCCFFKNFFNFF